MPTDSPVPVDVCADAACLTPLADVVAIDSRSWTTCALMNNGGIKCWGNNWMGQIGDGNSFTDSPFPVDVCADSACSGPLTGVAEIGIGRYHSCALMATGGVKCWGDNVLGELGDDQACGTGECDTPVDVVNFP